MTSCTIPGTARWNGFDASRPWKNTSGFCAVPRTTGASGVNPRARNSTTSVSRTIDRMSSFVSRAIFDTSWLVRNPSKKWTNGTRERKVAAWATKAKSWASCTLVEHSCAQPVERACITSW